MMNKKKSPVAHLYKYALVVSLILASYFVIQPLGVQTLQAKGYDAPTANSDFSIYHPDLLQEFTLTPKELKAFEGFYQFQKNPEAYLQFTVKDKGLIAKQVWDGKEFFILPKSALEFYSKKEHYPAKFIKAQDGVISQVHIMDKDVWVKVSHYTPRKTITLSGEKLKAFEGKYTFQFQPDKDAFIVITTKGNQLVLKEMWSGNEIAFDAYSDHEFYNRERAFPLQFMKDSNGTVTKVLAFNRDLWTRVGQ